MSEIRAALIDRSIERRFAAWTLYARAFAGNRVEADFLVRTAVIGLSIPTDELSSEADAHGRVLRSIRTSVLRAMQPSGVGSVPSVLQLLHAQRDDDDMAAAAVAARRRVRHLPRPHRRRIERVLLRRPPQSLSLVATNDGVDPGAVVETIESGLRNVAAGVRPGSNIRDAKSPFASHPALQELIAYVKGALSGDEARSVAAHGLTCSRCGDRLGTMMLLTASATETFRLPRVPRAHRHAAVGLFVASVLAGGLLLGPRLMPNPWEAHATHETVPRWFQDFFYRPGDERSPNETARGLALLVDGRYREAIDSLELVVQERPSDSEAATYLGIARYLSGDTSRRSVGLLEAGTRSIRAGRLARWYLANLLLTRGDLLGASRHLEALATTRDWFGRAAEALLEKLKEAQRSETTVARALGNLAPRREH